MAEHTGPVKYPTFTFPHEDDAGFRSKLQAEYKRVLPEILEHVAKNEDASQKLNAMLGLTCDHSEQYYLELWSWCKLHLKMEYREMMSGHTIQELYELVKRAIEDGAPPIRKQREPKELPKIDRKALLAAAELKHPELWGPGNRSRTLSANLINPEYFKEWLSYKERSDKPGTLVYSDQSPLAAKKIVPLLQR